uniref:Variant surface glycoprotein 352 n=1 Tax=Trypanosoma brucei TaxID=5691 RepID=M4SXX4_9TRYP|nr:variant surface glycoprotein 352 [Trypanosoma brucei]
MHTALICAVLLTMAMVLRQQAQGAVKDNEHGGDCAALCGLIQFAEPNTTAISLPQEITEIADELLAVNLSMSEAALQQLVTKHKDKSWDDIPASDKPAAQPYKEHWKHWQKLAADPKPETVKFKLEQFRKVSQNTMAKNKFHLIADAALELATEAKMLLQKKTKTDIDTKLTKALNGNNAPTNTFTFGGSTRAQLCGTGTTTPGEQAGKALLVDLLCICAGANTDTTAGKSCCKGCETSPNNSNWDTATNAKPRAEHIAKQCPTTRATADKSTTKLHHLLGDFYTQVNTAKGTGQEMKYALGTVGGNGNDGCTGKVGSTNNGRCVKYTDNSILKGTPQLDWVQNLIQAAADYDTRTENMNKIQRIADKMEVLNKTATTLLWEQQPVPILQTKATTTTTHQTAEETKQECKAITKAADCNSNGNCKWTKPDVKTGTHCELNTTTSEQAAQTGGGAAGATTTVKCSDYGTKDKCEEVNKGKDKPVCGWRIGKDNEDDKGTEKCRDSSILPNKHFALSVVSAAFAALLF